MILPLKSVAMVPWSATVFDAEDEEQFVAYGYGVPEMMRDLVNAINERAADKAENARLREMMAKWGMASRGAIVGQDDAVSVSEGIVIREVRAFDEMTDLVDAAEAMDRLYSVRKEWRERANPLLLGPEHEAVWIIEIEDEKEGDGR